jgi:hypothetical protein
MQIASAKMARGWPAQGTVPAAAAVEGTRGIEFLPDSIWLPEDHSAGGRFPTFVNLVGERGEVAR